LESNWRQLIGSIGWVNARYSSITLGYDVTLCAKLITPLHIGFFDYKWVVQFDGPGGKSGALAAVSSLFPDQAVAFILTLSGTFPYGYAVYPDN